MNLFDVTSICNEPADVFHGIIVASHADKKRHPDVTLAIGTFTAYLYSTFIVAYLRLYG